MRDVCAFIVVLSSRGGVVSRQTVVSSACLSSSLALVSGTCAWRRSSVAPMHACPMPSRYLPYSRESTSSTMRQPTFATIMYCKRPAEGLI